MNTQPPEASALAAEIAYTPTEYEGYYPPYLNIKVRGDTATVTVRGPTQQTGLAGPLGIIDVPLSELTALRATQPQSAGDRWIAPTNWIRPGKLVFGDEWAAVERLERISTPDLCPRTVEAAARVVRGMASRRFTKDMREMLELCAKQIEALATPKSDATDGSAALSSQQGEVGRG